MCTLSEDFKNFRVPSSRALARSTPEMEKHSSDAKSRSNREGSAGHSRKRLQEPPKFYSKNYLKRYNQSEVRGAPQPTSQATGKKSPPNDQTAALPPAKSQQKYVYLLFHLKVVYRGNFIRSTSLHLKVPSCLKMLGTYRAFLPSSCVDCFFFPFVFGNLKFLIV